MWMVYVASLYFSVFLLLVYIDKKNLFSKDKITFRLRNKPFISILVPAYNEEETIVRTLESAYNLDYPKDRIEVIAIDDGSKDRTKEVVEDYIKDKPHFHLISHKNMGKAASLNKALKMAKGKFFACLDADSFVDPLTLKKMLSLYYKENDPELAIITPAMKVHKPQNMLQKMQWLEYLVLILISRLSSHLDALYVAPGPFSLYRTDIIRKLGGFDEKNITEDQEIAYWGQKHQYRIKHCYNGYVYTTAPHKVKPFYAQRRRWYLGSIICLHKYKEILGNRKYGDFGIMQMVKSVAGYFIALTGISIALYFTLRPLFFRLRDMILVKFNIIPYIMDIQFKLNFLTFLQTDFGKGWMVIFIFCVGIFFFYQAHRNANEKMNKWGWLPLVPYFVFYYVLKGMILILSLLEFSRTRKVRW